MVFTTHIFVFYFLPVFLLVYFNVLLRQACVGSKIAWRVNAMFTGESAGGQRGQLGPAQPVSSAAEACL
jgi:hypothetical protein